MTNESGLEFEGITEKKKRAADLLKVADVLCNAKQLSNDKGFPGLSKRCEEAWDIIIELIREN